MLIKKKEEYDDKKSIFYEYLINNKNFQLCFNKISDLKHYLFKIINNILFVKSLIIYDIFIMIKK
jgi:hypothetical protein